MPSIVGSLRSLENLLFISCLLHCTFLNNKLLNCKRKTFSLELPEDLWTKSTVIYAYLTPLFWYIFLKCHCLLSWVLATYWVRSSFLSLKVSLYTRRTGSPGQPLWTKHRLVIDDLVCSNMDCLLELMKGIKYFSKWKPRHIQYICMYV